MIVNRTARSLLFFYLLTVLGPAAIMVDFLVEQDRIARELCVQRAVPEMARTCHGQCHLAKQLKAAEGKDQKAPRVPTFRFEVQFLDENTAVQLRPFTVAPTRFGEMATPDLHDGYPLVLEGVPWC